VAEFAGRLRVRRGKMCPVPPVKIFGRRTENLCAFVTAQTPGNIFATSSGRLNQLHEKNTRPNPTERYTLTSNLRARARTIGLRFNEPFFHFFRPSERYSTRTTIIRLVSFIFYSLSSGPPRIPGVFGRRHVCR